MKKLSYNVTIKPDGTWLINPRVRDEVNKTFHKRGENAYIEMSFIGIDKKRTDDQNAYYWAVVVPIVTAGFILQGNNLRIGSNRDYMLVHNLLKERFITEGDMVMWDRNGNKYNLNEKTTTNLDTRAFAKYLRDIKAWSFDCLGVDIPEPNEPVRVYENGELIDISVEEFLNSVKQLENNV